MTTTPPQGSASVQAPTPCYGIQSNLPIPSRLNLAGNISENWKKWKQVWDSFEIASRLNQQEDKYRVATFITCIGTEALEVYNGLPFENEEDKDVMNTVLELMERHCIGQTNVIYERYYFNNRKQESGESFDTYLTALKTLAKTCIFGPLTDELIRDRIVCGICDTGTRKKLLQEPKLNLQKCIDVCRSAETTASQMKVMSGREEVNALNHKEKKDGRDASPKLVNCKYCGRKHERSRDKCPAFGKECAKCGKTNHFAKLCKQKLGGRQRRKERIHRVRDAKTSQDSSDEEYCFTISSQNLEEQSVKSVSSQPIKSKIFATMEIKGHPVRFQVDSGATCNVISKNDLPNECPIAHSKQVLSMFNGSKMETIGKCRVNLVNPKVDEECETEFVVVNNDCTPLLGSKTVQKMKLIKVRYENISLVQEKTEAMGLTMQQIAADFHDVFTGEGKFEKKLHLELDTTIEPVKQPVRRIPVAMKPKLKQELTRLEELGVIKAVDTPTDWVSSLVLVKKPNGKLRVCIDPQPLNKALKRSHYPLPVIDDLLPDFSKAKVFSVCDVKNGFWHVELDEDSSYLTTFGTPFGRYRWLKMPFGISPAPEYFQHRLDQAIEGLPGVRTVADDILISGEGDTVQEAVKDHDKKLLTLLERCREKGVKLNKEKFKLKMTEIPYVGHVLTRDGLKPDPSKIDAIKGMRRPTDVKGVQRLVGLANYLTRFLKKLADICEPLRQLTRKDAEWHWSDVHESAFKKIKEAASQAPVLRYFDPAKETVLQCDASDTGLGATLLQNGQPVAYASRSLTDTERNYAQIEKELLAIVFGAEKFNQYTYGRKVIVESDHKPLEVIYRKPLVAAPKRLQRMLLRLQKYNLEIGFKPGQHMYLADTLSRAPLPNTTSRDEVLTIDKEVEEIHMVEFLPPRKASLDDIRKESLRDSTMQALQKVIREGWPETKIDLPNDVTPYFNVRDELSAQDGIIFKGDRCVVPKSLRPEVLSRIHRSHIGVEGCLRRARESVFWPGMNTAVKNFVRQCETCRTFEISQQKETLHPHEVPDRPWSKVGVDLFETNNRHYLVTVDYHSNYWEVDRLESSTTSKAVIYKLKQHFARHGIPNTVFSDNGPQFDSDEFRRFARDWEFNHLTSSPGHSQSNGMAESAVKTVKRLIKKANKDGTDPWLAILDHRNTPTEGMKSSPAQRLMSRRTRTLLPTSEKLLKPKLAENVQEGKWKTRTKQAFYYNRNARDLPPLKTGDSVRIQPTSNPKATWKKATVQEQVNMRSYKVLTEDGSALRRNRRHLKATTKESHTPTTQMPKQTELPSPSKHIEQETNASGHSSSEVAKPQEPAVEQPATDLASQASKGNQTRSGRITKPPSYLKDFVR